MKCFAVKKKVITCFYICRSLFIEHKTKCNRRCDINTQPYLYNILILHLCECAANLFERYVFMCMRKSRDRAPLWAYFYTISESKCSHAVSTVARIVNNIYWHIVVIATRDRRRVHCAFQQFVTKFWLIFIICTVFSLRAILHWCNCVVNSQVVSLWGILCRYFSTFYWLIWWINSFQVLIDDIENWFMRFVYSMLHHRHYLYFVIVFQSTQTN